MSSDAFICSYLVTVSSNSLFSKILYYISCLVAFKNMSFKLTDKNSLEDKLPTVPAIILDGLLSRFTETARSSSQYIFFLLFSAIFESLIPYLVPDQK